MTASEFDNVKIEEKLYLKDNIIPHDWLEIHNKFIGNLKNNNNYVERLFETISKNNRGDILYIDSNGIICAINIPLECLSLIPWSTDEYTDEELFYKNNNKLNNKLKTKEDGNTIKIRRSDIQIGRSEKIGGNSLSSRRS